MHATQTGAGVSPPQLLDRIVSELQGRLRKEQIETWFRGFRLVAVGDGEVEFAVPSGFARDWLTRNYLSIIEDSVRAANGGARVRVRLSLDTAAAQPPHSRVVDDHAPQDVANADPLDVDSRDAAPTAESPRSPGPSARVVDSALRTMGVPPNGTQANGANGAVARVETADLNATYTFEEFVVGPCNRLAHAASLAIGENPGRSYNPLFIHGNVGLGKTHLLQAVCHSIRQRSRDARVLYLSCEEFTNRFIRSIQNDSLDQFREFHRSIDVLVIDDIQFLANKEKTQDEFFHTFNALYNSQRQIVISSDRSPLEIPTIEERLVSRFKWGLVADMEVPCFETRVAIAKRKARSRGTELPDEVAYVIAERIDTNIRELEGAVVKVLGVATIMEREIDADLAEEALRGVALTRNAQVSLADIMGTITGEFSIPAREITGKSRTQAVSLPRQIGMYLSRELTEHSLEEIGRFFGNRDHTTVLYAVGKIKKRCKDDRMFRELLNNLIARLRG